MTRLVPHRPPRPVAYLVTCEHGGNDVPDFCATLFRGHAALLASHRGYDPGALSLSRDLARALRATLVIATVSRLVVELNRSPGRQFRFSPIMRAVPRALRDDVCRRHYTPYRDKVEAFIARRVAAGVHVVHLASHSFTPALNGAVRRADVGILYDPGRPAERALALRWQRTLEARRPRWIVRRNYPYRGTSDAFASYLRKRYDDAAYAGFELEVNQKHVRDGSVPATDRAAIVAALRDALAPCECGSVSASDASPGTRACATTRA